MVFAVIKLFQQPRVGADAAMRTARRIVIDQPGNPSLHALDHFQASGNDYLNNLCHRSKPSEIHSSDKS
jgi:hypothetical protein